MLRATTTRAVKISRKKKIIIKILRCTAAAAAVVERPVIIKHADRVHWLKRGNTNQPPARPAPPRHPAHGIYANEVVLFLREGWT